MAEQERDFVIELVVWDDHEAVSGWIATEDFHEWAKGDTTICVSFGLVVHEDGKQLVLAGALHANGFGDGQKILKSDIRERRTLRTYKRLPRGRERGNVS